MFKLFYSICVFLWINWSMFYQFIERTFMKTSPELLEKFKGDDPRKEWKDYIETIGVNYGSDKWYMLFDVISSPERIVYRKTGDCDDFSSLAYNYFGDKFKYDGLVYTFDGFYAITYGTGGHIFAIWKSKYGDIFRISNKVASFPPVFYHGWRNLRGKEIKVYSIIRLNNKGRYYIKNIEKF